MATKKDQIIFDETIENTLNILRVDTRYRRKVIKLLRQMQNELIAKLARKELSTRSRADINRLLKQSKKIIDEYYKRIEGTTDLNGVAKVTAASTKAGMDAAFAGQIGVSLPPPNFLESMVSSAHIQGAPAKAWWGKQAFDAAFKYNAIVRQGLLQGSPNGPIIAAVRDMLGIQRNHAAALVQTSAMSIANDARLATYKANDDLIESLIWRTALDGHVCPRCAARADLKWTTEGKPIKHSFSFKNPPIHFNDRCVLVPETVTFRDLGIDIDEISPSQRASADGPIEATTFEGFLERKGKKFQDKMLGTGRADLWRSGKITLQDLVTRSGKEMSLTDLKRKLKIN